ncbi:exo-alpha-sialidase [Paenibacillus thalictri]|uniref:Fibronectin type-III domain-containing protein n=1 Tax=Paenibacillus thalictri TaxID=2527873 RepID=A0A4Q9DPV4_9BACL|nr:exo-alpha-sialidase [Paenibacillus thalictri]TBL76261.1 hypothetical protein EYB31_19880 [Paenibacillus thalictri]
MMRLKWSHWIASWNNTWKNSFGAVLLAICIASAVGCIAPQTAQAAGEVIVDNSDAGFTTGGTWSASTILAGYYGPNYVSDGTSGADASSKWAKWTPLITDAGFYDIYMRWTADTNRPDAAPLEISYNGGVDTSKTVNQTQNHGTWVLIGRYALSAGSTHYVKLLATDSGYTIADAVKFVPAEVSDIIVDNTDSGFTANGTWGASTILSGYYGANYTSDGTIGADDANKWAKWTPFISVSGYYHVYMRWTADTNRPDAAPVEIVYDGGTDSSRTVNQQVYGGQWVLVGTYPFAVGSASYIKLLATDAGYTIADAVKLEYAGTTSPVADPTALSASTGSPSHLNLSWTDNASNEQGYRIERRKLGDSSWLTLGLLPANTTSYQSVGLLAGTTYEHRITAFRSDGVSHTVAFPNTATLTLSGATRGISVAPVSAGNPRNGEGGMIKLNDGSLLFLYDKFPSTADLDVGTKIAKRTSSDGGLTWSAESILFSNPSRGLIQPSLVRLANGQLGVAYTTFTGSTDAKRVFRTSTDEGATWSAEIAISDNTYNYVATTNDRIIRLASGRLVMPAHKNSPLRTLVYVSDDNGLTWSNKTPSPLSASGGEMWEADIVDVGGNELLLYARTRTGWLYESRSADNGDTWSTPAQTQIRYSISPPKLSRLPGTDTLILIGCGTNYVPGDGFSDGARLILSSQISTDGGRTWSNYKQIEYTGGSDWYHYPSILWDGSDAHLTYYRGNPFGGSYYVKLPSTWFTSNPAWPY